MNLDIKKRITIDPNICFGKPTVRGMRYTVEFILELLSNGMSYEEILEDYPSLEKEDILACIMFANSIVKYKTFQYVV